MKPTRSILLALITSALIGLLAAPAAVADPASSFLAAGGLSHGSSPQQLSYGTLLTDLQNKHVRSVLIDQASEVATVQLKGSKQVWEVQLPQDTTALAQSAHSSGASVSYGSVDNGFSLGSVMTLCTVFLLLGFVVALIYRSARQASRESSGNGRGGIGAGQSRASLVGKLDVATGVIPAERFSDVAGCDEVVEELREMIHTFTDPTRFTRVGAKMPRGVLLYGPPGTGKTLLAKAMAGELDRAYFSASGSSFVEMYVGVGAKRIRELFQAARKNTPSLVFIDEIDAIGRARSSSGIGGNEERENTLNELLTQLDGFSGRTDVIVIAATNRKDLLDPALLRAGRLESHVKVGAPGEKGRRDILSLYVQDKPLADDVDLDRLARDTAGSTGAELADMVNRAALVAARNHQHVITMQDMDDGHLWAIAGPKRKEAVFGDGEERKVAYHEAGHVITAEVSRTHEKAHRVSIEQRSDAGGLAKYGQIDRILHDQEILHEKMVCLLGGRAAEKEVFGVVSSGAQNDLQRVTEIAHTAVSSLALTDAIGQTIVETDRHQISDRKRESIERSVQELVDAAWRDALAIVHENRDALARLAEALLEQKDMDRCDITAAIGGNVTGQVQQPAASLDREPVAEPPTPAVPRRKSGAQRARRRARRLRGGLQVIGERAAVAYLDRASARKQTRAL